MEQGPVPSSSVAQDTTPPSSKGGSTPSAGSSGEDVRSAPAQSSMAGTAGERASNLGTSPVLGGGGSPASTKPASAAAGRSGNGGESGMNGGNAAAGSAGAMPPSTLSDTQALIPDPSWDCGMPDGIPAPASGEMLFEIDFEVAEVHDIGRHSTDIANRSMCPGGKVSGGKVAATLMDRGLDYQLTLDNGAVELEQIHILRAGGSPVHMRNCGVAPSGTAKCAWCSTSRRQRQLG